MVNGRPQLEMSATQVTDLVTLLGLSLRALRLQSASSPQRNAQIRLRQTLQRRFLSQLEGQSTRLVISLSEEEVATLRALLREITPFLEPMPPSFEKERLFHSLGEFQHVFARLIR